MSTGALCSRTRACTRLADVQDFVQTATLAIVAEVPVARIAHAIAPFPTRSELWLKFIEAYEKGRGRSLHTAPRDHGAAPEGLPAPGR
jgi:hypothetical protein